MRLGKVKESILKRSVLRQLHTERPFAFSQYKESIGFFPVEDVLVKVDPVEGWTLAAHRAVYGAVNSLAVADAVPEGIVPVVLMPKETEEQQLKRFMQEMDALCRQEAICCMPGHTAISPYVSTLLLSVTAIGKKKVPVEKNPKEKEVLWTKKAIHPDRDIVAAGTVGREGAAMLAWEREAELGTRYPTFFIEEAKHLFDDASMKKAADCARKTGNCYMHAIGEGGVFAGLWQLAAAGKVGLCIELKDIPIKQHTIEVCEYFRLNPYMLRSGGAFLMVCDNGERMVAALRQQGTPAAVIGRTTRGNDKIIRYDDEVRYLEPPKEDEYYKCIGTLPR